MHRTGLWFIAVGVAAAMTHMITFALVESRLWPELANATGFLVAFLVSFMGHRLLSFRDAGTTVSQSLVRFSITAVAGFVMNELVFVLLLRGLRWPSLVALFAALLVAAGQTFVLSRYWAFRR